MDTGVKAQLIRILIQETGGHKGRPLYVVDMEKIIFSGMQMQNPLRHREVLKHPDVWK